MTKTIGLIGAGNIGSNFALRWHDLGFGVNFLDPHTIHAETLEQRGAIRSANVQEVLAASDVTITSLPTPAVVDELYFGDAGIFTEITRDHLVIDTSTTFHNHRRPVASARPRT